MQKLCGGNPAARKSSIGCHWNLFRNGTSRPGIVPAWKPQRTTENSPRNVAVLQGGPRTNNTRQFCSRWPRSGRGWRWKPSKSVRENLRSTSRTRRRLMAERFGLVGEARPHLSHLQHRGSGLSVARGAGDLQALRRKPAILLGAPHLAQFQFPLRRVQRSRTPDRSALDEKAVFSLSEGSGRHGIWIGKFSNKAGSGR